MLHPSRSSLTPIAADSNEPGDLGATAAPGSVSPLPSRDVSWARPKGLRRRESRPNDDASGWSDRSRPVGAERETQWRFAVERRNRVAFALVRPHSPQHEAHTDALENTGCDQCRQSDARN